MGPRPLVVQDDKVLTVVLLVDVDAYDDNLGVVLGGGRGNNLLGVAVEDDLDDLADTSEAGDTHAGGHGHGGGAGGGLEGSSGE